MAWIVNISTLADEIRNGAQDFPSPNHWVSPRHIILTIAISWWLIVRAAAPFAVNVDLLCAWHCCWLCGFTQHDHHTIKSLYWQIHHEHMIHFLNWYWSSLSYFAKSIVIMLLRPFVINPNCSHSWLFPTFVWIFTYKCLFWWETTHLWGKSIVFGWLQGWGKAFNLCM